MLLLELLSFKCDDILRETQTLEMLAELQATYLLQQGGL